MILRRVALPEVAGALFLTAMPGRAAPLADFLAEAEAEGLGHVRSLTGQPEILTKSPAYAALLALGERPWDWRAHPVRDFGVPQDKAAFAAFIGEAAEALRGGARLALHCAAGIGRTGTAAVCLLVALGLEVGEAEERVRAAGSQPETSGQRRFAKAFRPA